MNCVNIDSNGIVTTKMTINFEETNRVIGTLVVLREGEQVEVGYLYLNDTFYSPESSEAISFLKQTIFNPARDALFESTKWVRERHSDRVELGIDDTENWTAWLTYWNTLRDLPNQPDFNPVNPVFPDKPK